MKIALIIGLVVLVLAFAVGSSGYWWLSLHKDELTKAGKTSFVDGAHYGTGKSADACVSEAERRLATIDGVIAEAVNKQFLSGCLKTATLPESFCRGVPRPDEILKSATWCLARCAAVAQQQPCTRLIG